ncbi:DUF2589 domain-containing protein [Nonlabens xiamenensis]|uniref:DUF2589 domain-containing protein n=1 Tax=Nonlabens xiamenensis TaxID=2341043 RepID=UPI000F60571A|nr:DUF2589 domain-containing protein [Nonlabens xiamenensis]
MPTSPSNYDPGQELSDLDFSSLIGGPLGAIVDAQSKAALATVDFVKSVGFTPDTEDEATGEITPGEPIYVSFKYPKLVQPYQPAVNDQLDDLTINSGGTGYEVGDTLIVDGITVNVTGVTATGIINAISFSGDGTSNVTEANGVAGTGGTGTGATFDLTTEDIDAVPAVFEEMKLEVPILTMMPIPFIRVDEGNIDFNAKITSMEYNRVGTQFKFGTSASMSNQNTNKNYSFAGSLNFNKNVNTVNLKTNVSYQRNTRQGSKVDKTFHMGVKIKVTQDEIPEGMEKLLNILEGAIVAQPTGN